jgi:hypothetical protein
MQNPKKPRSSFLSGASLSTIHVAEGRVGPINIVWIVLDGSGASHSALVGAFLKGSRARRGRIHVERHHALVDGCRASFAP